MYQLDLQSRTPIYQQLKEKILRLIGRCHRPGGPLPSVRVMARELGINPNTVAKAYQDLEKSGLIYSVAGKGSFISGEETLDRQMTASVLDRFREAVREARSAVWTGRPPWPWWKKYTRRELHSDHNTESDKPL